MLAERIRAAGIATSELGEPRRKSQPIEMPGLLGAQHASPCPPASECRHHDRNPDRSAYSVRSGPNPGPDLEKVMRAAWSWLLMAITVLPTTSAYAQRCGSVLHHSVTLTADVVCRPGQDGLIIAASGVTIDLNGFSVIGPWSSATGGPTAVGIQAAGVDGVTIRGSGRIKGFRMPIRIEGGVAHTITRVEAIAPAGDPTTLRNVSLSLVEASTISRLQIIADPGLNASENRVVRNRIGGSGGGGIWLYGCGAVANQVHSNTIDSRYAVAVGLFDGPNYNTVQDNKVTNGVIRLDRASANTIAYNTVLNPPRVGEAISLADLHYPATCNSQPSQQNRILANAVDGGLLGLYLEGKATAGAGPNNNLIDRNTFSNHSYAGIIFATGTFNNDARNNTYANVAAIVYDYGTGNLWP